MQTRYSISETKFGLVLVATQPEGIVRSDGGLGGYRWGIEMKQQLLASEGILNHQRQQQLAFESA